jgi:hypothetical protein
MHFSNSACALQRVPLLIASDDQALVLCLFCLLSFVFFLFVFYFLSFIFRRCGRTRFRARSSHFERFSDTYCTGESLPFPSVIFDCKRMQEVSPRIRFFSVVLFVAMTSLNDPLCLIVPDSRRSTKKCFCGEVSRAYFKLKLSRCSHCVAPWVHLQHPHYSAR